MTDQTLRNKAEKIGYSIHKGLRHYMYGSCAVAVPREVGYLVKDETSGFYVWDSYNQMYDHTWNKQDVIDFLKSEYERLELQF